MDNGHRLKYILHEGDRIFAGGMVYTITADPIGFGGTSVLYPACRQDSDTEFAIKECFPQGFDGFVREQGVIRPTGADRGRLLSLLDQYRQDLQRERKLGQRIRNVSSRAIGIWENLVPDAMEVSGVTYTDVSQGIYSVLERMDRKGMSFSALLQDFRQPKSYGEPLRTGGLPHIYTTLCMVEQTLLALDRIHRAGFLFGDIQDNNVFFTDCRLEQKDVGIGNLLDFGCARELEKDHFTAPITDKVVFSTKGFIPPEILSGNDGTLRLGKQADIYSVGCLMLRCVLSERSVRRLGDSPRVSDQAVDEVDAQKIGCSGWALTQLNRILQIALDPQPENRYPDAAAMLSDIQALKEKTQLPKYRLAVNMSPLSHFMPNSRDKELDRLTKQLQSGQNVYIWGMGGIGKTEVAIELARKADPVRGAYLVYYSGSMRQTILNMEFSDYQPETKKGTPESREEKDYRNRLDLLRQYYQGALLIIDNFDCPGKTLEELQKEPAFRDLERSGVQLVFTTRYVVADQPDNEIGALSAENQLGLMRRFYPDNRVSDEQLLTLIRQVQGHTLTVVLMAKTLQSAQGRITPEDMLTALQNRKMSDQQYPDVTTEQNRSRRQADIYHHLKAVFDLTGMSAPERTMLYLSAFLPDGGMDVELFRRGLQPGQDDHRKILVSRGWINCTHDGLLSIHPVIREMILEEICPDYGQCQDYLHRLTQWYIQDREGVWVSTWLFWECCPLTLTNAALWQLLEYFKQIFDYLENEEGRLGWLIPYTHVALGHYRQAKVTAAEILAIQEKRHSQNPPLLARCCGRMAEVLADADWEQCLTLSEQEEALRGQFTGTTDKEWYRLHLRQAKVYCSKFHYGFRWKQELLDKALAHCSKALGYAAGSKMASSVAHGVYAQLYASIFKKSHDYSTFFCLGPVKFDKLKRKIPSIEQKQAEHCQKALTLTAQCGSCPMGWQAVLYERLGDACPSPTNASFYRPGIDLLKNHSIPLPASQAKIYEMIAIAYDKMRDHKTALKYKNRRTKLTGNQWFIKSKDWAVMNLQRILEGIEKALQNDSMMGYLLMLPVVLAAMPVLVVLMVSLLAETIHMVIQRFKQKKQEK